MTNDDDDDDDHKNNNDNNNDDDDDDNDNDDEHVRVFDWRGAAMSKKKNPAFCDGNQVMGGAGEKLIEA